MENTTLDSILSKAKKLQALSERASTPEEAANAASKLQMSEIFAAEAKAKAMQGLTQGEQQHQQKLQQMKETSKSQPGNNGGTGKSQSARKK